MHALFMKGSPKKTVLCMRFRMQQIFNRGHWAKAFRNHEVRAPASKNVHEISQQISDEEIYFLGTIGITLDYPLTVKQDKRII